MKTFEEFEAIFKEALRAIQQPLRPHSAEIGALVICHHDDHGIVMSGNMCRACIARLLDYALVMMEEREGITPQSPCNEDEVRGPVGHA
jgi:hypothetical protein